MNASAVLSNTRRLLLLIWRALVVLHSTSLLLPHGELDLHSPIIDLRHVVVFNGTIGRGGTGVNHGGGAKVGAELISIKSSVDQGTTLAEKFFEILH